MGFSLRQPFPARAHPANYRHRPSMPSANGKVVGKSAVQSQKVEYATVAAFDPNGCYRWPTWNLIGMSLVGSAFLFFLCAFAALGVLTDGFSTCKAAWRWRRIAEQSQELPKELGREPATGIRAANWTQNGIRDAFYLTHRMDRTISPCSDFYGFACGGRGALQLRDNHRLEFLDELSELLNPRSRPSLRPARLQSLFDFYDSCADQRTREQRGLQPFLDFVSRMGGWPLLQNGQLEREEDTAEWEPLQRRLADFGIDALLRVHYDPAKNSFSIGSPRLLLDSATRPALTTLFHRLLEAIGVDEELGAAAVDEALSFEMGLRSFAGSGGDLAETLSVHSLRQRFPFVRWDGILQMWRRSDGEESESRKNDENRQNGDSEGKEKQIGGNLVDSGAGTEKQTKISETLESDPTELLDSESAPIRGSVQVHGDEESEPADEIQKPSESIGTQKSAESIPPPPEANNRIRDAIRKWQRLRRERRQTSASAQGATTAVVGTDSNAAETLSATTSTASPPEFPLLADTAATASTRIDSAYMERLRVQLGRENGHRAAFNYAMLRGLHSLGADLTPKLEALFRKVEERRWRGEDEEGEQRECVEKTVKWMPKEVAELRSRAAVETPPSHNSSLRDIRHQIGQIQWMDTKTKKRIGAQIDGLRVRTLNPSNSTAMDSVSIDIGNFFENILALRQRRRLAAGGDGDAAETLIAEKPLVDSERREIVYGPVAIRRLHSLPPIVAELEIRQTIFRLLFAEESQSKWSPESRAIWKAKRQCFGKTLQRWGATAAGDQIYTQMALQSMGTLENFPQNYNSTDSESPVSGRNLKVADSNPKNRKNEKFANSADLDPISRKSRQSEDLDPLDRLTDSQRPFAGFAASLCNQQNQPKDLRGRVNGAAANSDHFAAAFHCPIGSPMNPRDKCSLI